MSEQELYIPNLPPVTPPDYTGQNRSVRNSLLTGSDWTQSPDSPLSDEKKAEWATYRQALRDIENFQDPVWPAVPSK